jgi:hypothetical protein
MIKHTASHLDHNLTAAQLAFLLERFAARDAFFIETFELPDELGTIPCGLFGPLVGDPAIADAEVTLAPRGTRAWPSRIIGREPRPSRLVTVIAGPHEETCPRCEGDGGPCGLCDHGKIKHACILYTAFGGPLAPQESGDPGCKDVEASRAFWKEHALAQ